MKTLNLNLAKVFLKRLIAINVFIIFAIAPTFRISAQDNERIELIRVAEEEMAKIEQSSKVCEDKLLNEYINALGQRLVPKDIPPELRFSFKVIEEPTLNAFALPNGAIYIHSGILARLENEAQLAMILAHEITHVAENHAYEGMKHKQGVPALKIINNVGQGIMTQFGWKLPTIQLSPEQLALLAYAGNLAKLASAKGYDRSREDEADRVGLELICTAEFDPREAPKPFELLLRTYGDESKLDNFFYGNHSRNQDRIKNINKLLTKNFDKKFDGQNLVTNSTEFRRRTLLLVLNNAIKDYELKRYQLAKAGFERVIEVAPKDYAAHYHLGNVYREFGRTAAELEKAISEYVRAIENKPDYAPAYRELGLAYYKKRNYQVAIAALEKYLKLDPEASDRKQIEYYLKELKMY